MKQEEMTQKTRQAMADSLKKAMIKKPFSKITVRDITDDCNINRNTFYYHFEDIYALLHWMFSNEAIKVIQKFDLLTEYEAAISFVIDYVDANDHIINCALDSIGQKELKRFFFPEFYDIVLSLLNSAEKHNEVTLDPEYKSFLAIFHTEAMTGLLVEWISHREKHLKEKLIAYLVTTVKSSILGIFEHSEFCQAAPPVISREN